MQSNLVFSKILLFGTVLGVSFGADIISKAAFSVAAETPKIAAEISPKPIQKPIQESRQILTQLFRQNVVLQSGETIELRIGGNDTLYIGKGERKAVELLVDRDVVSESGVVLIPVGAVVGGEFAPIEGGTMFVAKTLTSRGGTVRMNAESVLINDVKDPRETGIGAIAVDGAIGAAAGALLAGIFGDRSISTEKILGGAAAGVLVGNVTAPQVVVIEPSKSIKVITKNNLTFRIQD